MFNRLRGKETNKFQGTIPDIECERPSGSDAKTLRLLNTDSVDIGGGTGTGKSSSHRNLSRDVQGTSQAADPSPSKNSHRRRRRRSLTLCESFSDDETTDGTLLRTGSFSEKVSKKWSLPVPSSTSRGSRGSESTENSYTSRSSAEVDSISGGETSPVDFRLGRGASSLTPGSSGVSESRKKKWTKAAQSHSFCKIYSHVFERCKSCDTYIYLSGYKCEQCKWYFHGKCLRTSLLICGGKSNAQPSSALLVGSSRNKLSVFGNLLELSPCVPLVIVKCCHEIEKRGYAIRGIYRVNGSSSRVRKLVRSFEINPKLVDLSETNCNDLSNVIKEYFRSLPDPLFMSALYREFISTSKKYHSMKEEEREERKQEIIVSLKLVTQKLHLQHQKTLSYLMHHLKFISDNSQINQMCPKNLGLVFAPSLFRIKYPEGEHLLVDLFDNSFQALTIELLITYCLEIFGDPPPKDEDEEEEEEGKKFTF